MSGNDFDQFLRDLEKKIADIGDRFCFYAETTMAMSSLERILEERFGMEAVSPRARVRREGREQEYDVLAWANGKINTVVVVEVESLVKREAIAQLQQQIEELPQMMPIHRGKSRIGILAGYEWDHGVMAEAQAVGLYTATIHDEVFELTTPEGFEPKRW